MKKEYELQMSLYAREFVSGKPHPNYVMFPGGHIVAIDPLIEVSRVLRKMQVIWDIQAKARLSAVYKPLRPKPRGKTWLAFELIARENGFHWSVKP